VPVLLKMLEVKDQARRKFKIKKDKTPDKIKQYGEI